MAQTSRSSPAIGGAVPTQCKYALNWTLLSCHMFVANQVDALTQKVREAGRIVNVSVVVATAVNSEGKREIVGMDVGTSEDGAFWLAFLRTSWPSPARGEGMLCNPSRSPIDRGPNRMVQNRSSCDTSPTGSPLRASLR